MIAVLLNDSEVEFKVGRGVVGCKFKEVTITFEDTLEPNFSEYFEKTILTRLIPKERISGKD